jgi:inositol-phosphate phosphatase/L-galactose 1-phosphate phosphatase/histidinol-phosphatase
MPTDDLASLARVADELADCARRIARSGFRNKLTVNFKKDRSPVTAVDLEIEAALRELLGRRRPDDGIYGEELGGAFEGRVVWVLDPIDGTKSFASGNPLFGTLIGVLIEGAPAYGVIDMPVLAERWEGGRGAARFQGSVCRVSDCTELSNARLYCTSLPATLARLDERFLMLEDRVAFSRHGGDCYAFGLFAAGYCDLCVETGMQPYDYLPIVPIIEGAGGTVSDWQGRPLTTHSDGTFIAASTPELWQTALRFLEAVPWAAGP